MNRLRRPLVALSALMALQASLAAPALAAPAHQAAAATPPRKLGLTIAEINSALGGGFTNLGQTGLGSTPGFSNLAIVKKAGYVTGYEVTLVRQHPLPLQVSTGVNLFRSTTYARAGITRLLHTFNTPTGRKEGIRVTRVSGVGELAVLFSFKTKEAGRTFGELGYLFSRGSYAGEVLAIGAGNGLPSRAAILSLAQRLDNRIQHG